MQKVSVCGSGEVANVNQLCTCQWPPIWGSLPAAQMGFRGVQCMSQGCGAPDISALTVSAQIPVRLCHQVLPWCGCPCAPPPWAAPRPQSPEHKYGCTTTSITVDVHTCQVGKQQIVRNRMPSAALPSCCSWQTRDAQWAWGACHPKPHLCTNFAQVSGNCEAGGAGAKHQRGHPACAWWTAA